MARWDEDDPFGAPPRPPATHAVGQPLDTLSVHELDERIGLLRSEIERLEQARSTKQATRAAASSFFKG